MPFAFQRHPIAPDLHVFRADMGPMNLVFNSFLLLAERPVLFHTGFHGMWRNLRPHLEAVLPLERLAYVVVPHVEADECGALPLLLQETQPAVVASPMGSRQLAGLGLVYNAQAATDGQRLDLGDRELELITVPSEMHLWDGLMAFDRKTGTLFSSDFLSQVGVTDPVQAAPDRAGMAEMASRNIPATGPYGPVIRRLLALDIRMVAPGHGACFTRDIPDLVQGYFSRTIDPA